MCYAFLYNLCRCPSKEVINTFKITEKTTPISAKVILYILVGNRTWFIIGCSTALGPITEAVILLRIPENPHICERKLFKNILRYIKNRVLSLFQCFVFRHVFLETFHIFQSSIPRDIVADIFYADLQWEYIEWMEIAEHFISIPEAIFTRVKKS